MKSVAAARAARVTVSLGLSISRTPSNADVDPNGDPPDMRTESVRTASIDNWNRSVSEIRADAFESIFKVAGEDPKVIVRLCCTWLTLAMVSVEV